MYVITIVVITDIY